MMTSSADTTLEVVNGNFSTLLTCRCKTPLYQRGMEHRRSAWRVRDVSAASVTMRPAPCKLVILAVQMGSGSEVLERKAFVVLYCLVGRGRMHTTKKKTAFILIRDEGRNANSWHLYRYLYLATVFANA